MNTSNRVPALRHQGAMTGWGFGGLARLWHAMLVIVVAGWSTAGLAQTVTLDRVDFASLPGDQVRIELTLSAPTAEPLVFAVDDPARMALDFRDVGVNLPRRTVNIDVGMARSITAVEAAGAPAWCSTWSSSCPTRSRRLATGSRSRSRVPAPAAPRPSRPAGQTTHLRILLRGPTL
jgi:hypothetical protein